MLTKVLPGTESVSLTPSKRHGRAYHMGTVILGGVTVYTVKGQVHVVGTVLHEAVEQDQPTHKVRGKMEKYSPKMGMVERGGAYVVGNTVFIAKDLTPKEEK